MAKEKYFLSAMVGADGTVIRSPGLNLHDGALLFSRPGVEPGAR
jgi:hypothetical protein